jgi:hypothetical protein
MVAANQEGITRPGKSLQSFHTQQERPINISLFDVFIKTYVIFQNIRDCWNPQILDFISEERVNYGTCEDTKR